MRSSSSDRVAGSGSTIRIVAAIGRTLRGCCPKSGWRWYERGMSEPKILVVDDDDDIRALVCTLLTRSGVAVREAANGREGMREFHAYRPDLVVLDVSMPELDGWEMLDRIRDMSNVP